MAIEAAPSSHERYCPRCKKMRAVAQQLAPDAWAYCPRCGTILIRPEMRRRYAGFWRRAGGYAIDYGVVLVLEVVFILLIQDPGLGDLIYAASIALAITFGLGAIAYVVVGNAQGATFGKAAMGLRIVDAHGNPPGLKRSLGRYLMSILSGILGLGYLAMIWDDQKQTWHDHAADTYVIRR